MEGESKGTRESESESKGEEGGRVRGVWVRSAAWLTSENE